MGTQRPNFHVSWGKVWASPAQVLRVSPQHAYIGLTSRGEFHVCGSFCSFFSPPPLSRLIAEPVCLPPRKGVKHGLPQCYFDKVRSWCSNTFYSLSIFLISSLNLEFDSSRTDSDLDFASCFALCVLFITDKARMFPNNDCWILMFGSHCIYFYLHYGGKYPLVFCNMLSLNERILWV